MTGLFARLMTDVDQPVLDAGRGTGGVGFILSRIGYKAIDGIDLSKGMLDRAAQVGGYRSLSQAVLVNRWPLKTARTQAWFRPGSSRSVTHRRRPLTRLLAY